MKPRLLHVFSTFVPAGPEMRTVRLINAFGERYRHAILAMDGRMDARVHLDPELDVELLEPLPKAGSLRTSLAMRKLLRREEPHLLLTYNWGAFDAVMAARSLGMRNVVHHEDGFTPDELGGFKSRRVRARRFFLSKVARVIVPSMNLKRIAETHWNVTSPLVQHVPNGIDLSAFAVRDGNRERRAVLGIPEDAPVLGAVGHLRPEKNFARLLRAARPLCRERGAHVVVLGEGGERAGLEELRASFGAQASQVHLVGHQAEPAPWYRMFDVFCISSDTEQMPVSLLEAMATGLPVVSTEVGDVRDMLPGEQAICLVGIDEDEERTIGDLEAALRRVLDDEEDARELGVRNLERVSEEYGFERMLGAYEAAWEHGLSLR